MAEFRLFRTGGNSDQGDYDLRFDDDVKESWQDVSRQEADEKAQEYIGEEVMSFGPPEARQAFKQVPIHIPFTDETVQS